eukprot:IDg14699t1
MSAEETPPAMRRNAFVHLPCRTRSMTGSRSWQQQSPCGASLTVEYKPLQNDDVSTDSIDDSEHERALPQVCQALIESGQIPLWEPNRHALVSDGDSVQPADKSNVTNLSTHLNNSGAEQDASNEIVIPAKVTESEVFEADCVTRKGEISYTADIEAEDLPMTQHYNESSKSSGSNESKGDNPLPRTNKFGNDESAETQKPTDMEIETEDNVLLEDDLKLNEKVAVIVMELKALRTLETVVRDKLGPAMVGFVGCSALQIYSRTSFVGGAVCGDRTPEPSRTAPRNARLQRIMATTTTGPSWTDHKPVTDQPDSFVRGVDSSDPGSMRTRFEKMIRDAQDSICAEVELLDGGKFHEDAWVRENGGGGISRVLQGGNVFEKAGVNVSVVYGTMPPEAVAAASARGVTRDVGFKPGEPVPFFAAGISSVMHPWNPMAPTMHFNYRYFETERGLWWFGGGTDLTPAYLFEEDARHFHGSLKETCSRHDPEFH